MDRCQCRTWSTFNSIKTLFGYRSRYYQPVSQIEIEESKCSIDENTSCLEDKISLEEHIDNINIKQIDEILPLMNKTAFNFQNILPPISSYANDTRPDVDLLDC